MGLTLSFLPADSEDLHSWNSEETPKSKRARVWGYLCKAYVPCSEAETQGFDRNNGVEMKSNICEALTLGSFYPIQASQKPHRWKL